MQRQAEVAPITAQLNELTWDILPAEVFIPIGAVGAAALFGRFIRDPSNRKGSLAGATLLAAGTLVEVFAWRHATAEDEVLRAERAAIHRDYDQRIEEVGGYDLQTQ
jgi:hypothetical protein